MNRRLAQRTHSDPHAGSERKDAEEEGEEPPSLPPVFLRARTFNAQTQQWAPLRVAIVLPSTSLEDYDYEPHRRRRRHGGNAATAALGSEAVSKATERDMTMWMYVQPVEEQRKRNRKHAKKATGTSPCTTQPPSRARSGRLKERAADDAGGSSPVAANSPSSPLSPSADSANWTKLKVGLVVPRAASHPLSQDLRAGLQLSLVDSQAMTYTSHGTPRMSSLLATPTTYPGIHEPQQASQSLPESRQDSSSNFLHASGSYGRAAGAQSHSYDKACERDPKASNSPHTLQGSASLEAGRQKADGRSTPVSEPRLLHALSDSPHRLRMSSGGGLARPRGAGVDSVAELYQIEVHGVTVAAGTHISAAEQKLLNRSSRGVRGKHKTSPSTATEPAAADRSPLSYRKVKGRLLSWLGRRRDTKANRKLKGGRATSPASPLRRENTGTVGGSPTGSPSGTLFPVRAKLTFLLRFYAEEDFTLLLRWYVWMWHTREERRKRQREAKERQSGRTYISYDPRDIEQDNRDDAEEDAEEKDCILEVDNSSLWEREAAGDAALQLHLQESISSFNGSSPLAPPRGGRSGGLAALCAVADQRWEQYIRRSCDPRNDIAFAKVPVYLWHSFLPLASSVWYHCDRGFLAIEASQHSDWDEILSPLKAARHVDPASAFTAEGQGETDAKGGSGGVTHNRLRRHKSWNTVKLVVSSPVVSTPSFPTFAASQSAHSGVTAAAAAAAEGPSRHPGRSQTEPYQCADDRTAWKLPNPVGAEFKDCFLCLTESHVLFYNSFGELKVHLSLDHVEAVLYSARRYGKSREEAATKGPGKTDGNEDTAAATEHEKGDEHTDDNSTTEAEAAAPLTYPFVCFRIKAGSDELAEPPLVVTFTFLPLFPHLSPDTMARDGVPGPQGLGAATGPDLPTFLKDGNRFHHARSASGSASDSSADATTSSCSSTDEDYEVYQARMRQEAEVLIERKNSFLTSLTQVMPNTLSKPMTFDAYVRVMKQRAELPVHPTMGRLGADTLDSKIPLVEIYKEDVTMQLERTHSSSYDSGSTLYDNSSGNHQRKPPPPRSPPCVHNAHSVSSSSAMEAHGLVRNAGGDAPLVPPTHVLVPRNRPSASYCGAQEHRRLQSVYENSSSLSRNLAAAHSPQSMSSSVAGMERVNDLDLTMRLAANPPPLVLDKEDLFLPPLRYYTTTASLDSSSQHSRAGGDAGEGAVSPTAVASHNLHQHDRRHPLGGGRDAAAEDVTRASTDELHLGDVERSPVQKRKPKTSATNPANSSGAAERPLSSSSHESSTEANAGSPFNAVRPRKRHSRLTRAKKAAR